MADRSKEFLVSWLKDAHAMEQALEKTLTRQADHARHDPTMQARIERHVSETREQARRLESCLHKYGADTSTFKDTMAKMQGIFQGLSTGTSDDTKVKDVLAGIGAEHFEIACYKSLQQAAELLGDTDTAAIARQNCQEEEEFASFLEQQLADATRSVLLSSATHR